MMNTLWIPAEIHLASAITVYIQMKVHTDTKMRMQEIFRTENYPEGIPAALQEEAVTVMNTKRSEELSSDL
jgi:hypothetical protein